MVGQKCLIETLRHFGKARNEKSIVAKRIKIVANILQ